MAGADECVWDRALPSHPSPPPGGRSCPEDPAEVYRIELSGMTVGGLRMSGQ